jgi:hypothetical protein
MRAVIIAVAMLTCSTWQQIITCAGPDGYVSHEAKWSGLVTGDDNQGGKWTRMARAGDHHRHAPAREVTL